MDLSVPHLGKLVKSQSTGQLYLTNLQKYITECKTVLLLGEPDYIELYLRYYPIVQASFLLSSTDDASAEGEIAATRYGQLDGERLSATSVDVTNKTRSSSPSEAGKLHESGKAASVMALDVGGHATGLYAIPEEDDTYTQ